MREFECQESRNRLRRRKRICLRPCCTKVRSERRGNRCDAVHSVPVSALPLYSWEWNRPWDQGLRLVRPFARDEAQSSRRIIARFHPQTTEWTDVCRSGRTAWTGRRTIPDRHLAEIYSVQTGPIGQLSLHCRVSIAEHSSHSRPSLVASV